MKDFITRLTILLGFMGTLAYVEASYEKQVYRQDYNTTDKNHATFTYNDKMQVGKTTAAVDIAVIIYGTGSITLHGVDHSVEITTAGIKVDGVLFSTNTQANNDARYLSISSGAAIQGKLNDCPGVVVSTTIGDGTVTQTDLAVWYATSSVYAVFTDTIAVNLIGLATIQRLPFDAVLKSWYIVGNATGTATVAISTGMLTGTGVTFGVSSISAVLNNTQYATGALGGETIPRGNYMRFIVTAVGTCKEIYVNVEVWRRQ